jgi:hypothetical protein
VTVERGLVLDGRVLDVPGSEIVHRDTDAWWSWDVATDQPDLRRRLGPCRLLGGHWTAGHCRTGPTTARRVVEAMKARRKDDDGDGVIDKDDPLADVSVGFVNGWDGVLWQTADLRWATVHMARGINPISVGCENTWPGTARQARKLGIAGTTEVRRFGGRRIECLRPSPEMIRSYVELARMLTTPAIRTATGGLIAIDRVLAAPTGHRRGHLEHWQAPSSKGDAADYLNDALRADGWR